MCSLNRVFNLLMELISSAHLRFPWNKEFSVFRHSRKTLPSQCDIKQICGSWCPVGSSSDLSTLRVWGWRCPLSSVHSSKSLVFGPVLWGAGRAGEVAPTIMTRFCSRFTFGSISPRLSTKTGLSLPPRPVPAFHQDRPPLVQRDRTPQELPAPPDIVIIYIYINNNTIIFIIIITFGVDNTQPFSGLSLPLGPVPAFY